jgi:lipopolysaccharide export system protein LptA
MLKQRKFLVWLIAVAVVFLIYLSYNRLVDTPDIQIRQDRQDTDDIEVPDFDDQSASIGGAAVGAVERARYTVLDENKNVKRIFGFAKLLNPDEGSEKWKLQEPYMNVYQQDVRYEIVSDRGTVQVETVAGNPSPTDAHLIDNVRIHIRPVDADGPVESTIYLDDLIYNSERSEFRTDGPITIISEDGKMEGKGMLLIYNNTLNRVEYLRIIDLDYLHLKDISTLSSSKPSPGSPQSPSASTVANAGRTSRPVEQSLDTTATSRSQETQKGHVDDAPIATTGSSGSEESDHYRCQFNNDVVITYGQKIIATGADEVAIKNILLSRRSAKKDAVTGQSTDAKEFATESSPAKTEAKAAISAADDSGREPARSVPEVVGTEVVDDDAVDVFVRCKGGILIRPASSIVSTDVLPAKDTTGKTYPDTVENTSGSTPTTISDESGEPPTRFSAKKIDYDMTTRDALADGPVEFTFYVKDANDTDPHVEPVPIVITATENAEFFSDQNRVVFNGNVVGTRQSQTAAYLQKSTFQGQKLIVDLAPAEQQSTDIRHVTVIGGKVRLESIRSVDDIAVNWVRLTCQHIDYAGDDEVVIATGPGDIQINNENAPVPDKEEGDKKISLQRPCYALVEGFDKLRWFTSANRISADGKTESVNINYLPIVEGEWGQVVHVATTHMEAQFMDTPSGRSELATLKTTGGVTYREVGENDFIGDSLFYDTSKSLMTITSSQQVPCYLNGAPFDSIDYNLKTGKAKGRLASRPGALRTPAGRKRK